MKRITPLNPVTLQNLHCFNPEQTQKIMDMEPEGMTMVHQKAKTGRLLDDNDHRKYGELNQHTGS